MGTFPELSRLIGRLRLRHLALLDLLGRDPNLGRSAKQLHMAQPTASKLLREVEDVLGVTLFTRNRRGLTPTLAGQVMTSRARVLMGEMGAAHAELRSAEQGGTGQLRVGVFPVAIPTLLPRLHDSLECRFPGLHLSVEEAVESALLARLSNADIDCVIGRIVVQALTSDLRHEALYSESTVIVCGVRHPILRARHQARAELLQRCAWMLPDATGATYNMVASWLGIQGVDSPRIEVKTSSVFATIEMLNHSTLLAVLPKSVALIYAKLAKVALVPGGDLISDYPVGVIYRATSTLNPMIEAALDALREEFRNPSK